ncbi:UNVERIFIED_CONTAM: Alcohol-forming fatty acyl-CoA reductase [Sesamum radiatum]|uniref:Fatty acyl-CoA reductase n=1 Tax=Sesamum radiatum TaxID=300843 RepID=A0AAW2W561_SESRA
MLLQVSTAFVHDTKKGLIAKKPFGMGETLDGSKISYLDINMEKKIIEERLKALQMQKATEIETTRAMKDLGIERAMLHGWPNTYVFTKAIGEMLLENFEKAKIVIIRPTIVTSTYKESFPGWIEGVRTMDSIFVAYGKGKLKFFAGDPNSTPDMIPGDMVVNCMLAAIAIHSNHHQHNLFIYHIGSSRRNPVKYAKVKSLMQRYLTENPLLDSRGRPIKVAQLTILSTMASFHNYIAIHYLPFLQILKLANMIFCNLFGSIYANARRRLSTTMRLTELYKPYLFSQGVFDDMNTENLRRMIKESNTKVMLNFDPKCIQWDEYFVNTHFKGLTKYVLK